MEEEEDERAGTEEGAGRRVGMVIEGCGEREEGLVDGGCGGIEVGDGACEDMTGCEM